MRDEDVEEALIELAYVWGDIERIILASLGHTNLSYVTKAFRVEVWDTVNDFGDQCTPYVLLFDVADKYRRAAARMLTLDLEQLSELLNRHARTSHQRDNLMVKQVPLGTPVKGQVCRRAGEAHPAAPTPDLSDLPTQPIMAGSVPLTEIDGYQLTPIEVPFYKALRETGLVFAVQPWIQGTDRRYRPDFLVFYDGGAVVVELDGHEYHKTKEQRGHDATKDRWFQERGVRPLRWTGSQVTADPDGCVRQLLDVLRGSQARP